MLVVTKINHNDYRHKLLLATSRRNIVKTERETEITRYSQVKNSYNMSMPTFKIKINNQKASGIPNSSGSASDSLLPPRSNR